MKHASTKAARPDTQRREALPPAGSSAAVEPATTGRPPVHSPTRIERGADPDRMIQMAYYHLARRGFPTDSALADAVGVHRSQVARWKGGEGVESPNAWLLRDIATAVARLADAFSSDAIYGWLYGSNPDLEDLRPIDLLQEGRLPEVLMAVQASASGAFG